MSERTTYASQLSYRILEESMTRELTIELRNATSSPSTASAIIATLLERARVSGSPVQGIILAMARLEHVAESDPELAVALMAHLWGPASKVEGAFEVTDAIDLWIADARTPATDVHLRYLAEESSDVRVAEHFRDLGRP